jgi:hypothetical protein
MSDPQWLALFGRLHAFARFARFCTLLGGRAKSHFSQINIMAVFANPFSPGPSHCGQRVGKGSFLEKVPNVHLQFTVHCPNN